MPTNENICNIQPSPQTSSQRYLHVFQDGGREEKMVNPDFFLKFEIFSEINGEIIILCSTGNYATWMLRSL